MLQDLLIFLSVVAGSLPPALEPERPVTVQLAAGPPESLSIAWTVSSPTAQRFVIEAHSLDVDTGLRVVVQHRDAAPELIVEDDDSGLGTDARLAWRAEAGVPYMIELHPVEEDWGGDVELRLWREEQAPALPSGEALAAADDAYWLAVIARAQSTRSGGREGRGQREHGLRQYATGDFAGAQVSFQRAVDLLESRSSGDLGALAFALHGLGSTTQKLGHPADAERYLRRALVLRASRFGVDSIEVGYTMSWLAESVWSQERLEEAETLYLRTIDIYSKRLGPDHRETGWQLRSLGMVLSGEGKQGPARERLSRALSIAESSDGADSAEVEATLEDLAGVLWSSARYAEAASCFARIVGIRERSRGADPSGLMKSLTEESSAWQMAGDFAAGRAAAQKAVAIAEVHPGLSPQLEVGALHALGMSVALGGDLTAGIRMLSRAIALEQATIGRHDRMPELQQNFAFLLQKAGDQAALDQLIEETKEEAAAADEAQDIPRLLEAAQLLMLLGSARDGVTPLRRAAELSSKQPQPSDAAISAHGALAMGLASLGEYDEARAEGLKTIQLVRELHGQDNIQFSLGLAMLTEFETYRGEYEAADRAISEAEAIEARRSPVNDDVYGRVLAAKARLDSVMGRAEAAEKGLRAALVHQQRVAIPRDPDLCESRRALADVLRAEGRLDEAEQQCLQALEDLSGGYRPQELTLRIDVQTQLAGIQLEAGRPRQGLQTILAMIDTFETGLGNANPLARMALESMREDLAENAPDGSIGAAMGTLGAVVFPGMPAGYLQQPQVYSTVGELLLLLGRPRDAAVVFRLSASRAGQLDAWGPQSIRSLDGLARAEWASGDEAGARESASRAASLLDRSMRTWISVLPEGQALSLARDERHPEDILFAGLLLGKTDKPAWLRACWESTLRRRGLVLEELAARNRQLLDDTSEESAAAWSRLAEARKRLAALALSVGAQPLPAMEQAIDRAIAERNTAETELARRSAAFRESRKVEQADLSTVSGALPGESALVEYVRFHPPGAKSAQSQDRYVALILPGGDAGEPSWVDLGPAASLDVRVEQWQRALERAWGRSEDSAEGRELLRAGQTLRRVVWDPIVARVPEARLVFVVPDGRIHRVELDALPAGKGYVAEGAVRVHVLDTGRDVVRMAGTARRAGTELPSLIVGDPDFDQISARGSAAGSRPTFRGAVPPCFSIGRVHWERLPASRQEADEVAALLPEAGRRVLEGGEATEDRVKSSISGGVVVHLATHAFFVEGSCGNAPRGARGIGGLTVSGGAGPAPNAVVQNPEAAAQNPNAVVQNPKAVGHSQNTSAPGPGGIASRPRSDNPLLDSGLVLAGANRMRTAGRDQDDGILTAEEIASLDLRRAQLVTLSACDTGRGAEEPGEGVLGLRRAFEIAGAQSLLMSLWSVPDESARPWMAEFYRSWVSGQSVVDAAIAAKRRRLSDLRRAGLPTHPYAWAGFITAGDWR